MNAGDNISLAYVKEVSIDFSLHIFPFPVFLHEIETDPFSYRGFSERGLSA